MKKALYSRKHFLLFLLLGMCFVAKAAQAQAASSAGASLLQQYHKLGRTFWDAEKQLQQRDDSFSLYKSIYSSPLSQRDPLYKKYIAARDAAAVYIEKCDDAKGYSWTLPPALYLGGLSAFTVGDYTSAQKYFSRLLEEYPDYKRDLYIDDRYAPNPDFAQPVKPAVTKLIFYCQVVGTWPAMSAAEPHKTNVGAQYAAPTKESSPTGRGLGEGNQEKGKDAFATFQQFNQSVLKVLLSQNEYANWLLNRPHQYQRRDFYIDECYGRTPDQMRATVLPKTAQLIKDGWEQLFPAALKKSGSLKMREYLREFTQPDSLLKDIATPRLADVDQLVIKHYFAQAKVLLRKHNFSATRKKYQQIIAEYPDSDASRRAEVELPKTVPIAVNYYQQVATKNFRPAGNIGVPQKKASLYYKKMFEEDKTGPKADIALYYWARALGTEGKIQQEVKLLQQHLATFPHSKLRSEAMYLLGFTYCNHQLRDYKRGVPLLLQVAGDFPHDKTAPEAIWNAAYILAWNKQYQRAIPLLQQLKRQYPKSKRAKHADKWIAEYQKKS